MAVQFWATQTNCSGFFAVHEDPQMFVYIIAIIYLPISLPIKMAGTIGSSVISFLIIFTACATKKDSSDGKFVSLVYGDDAVSSKHFNIISTQRRVIC